MNEQPLVSIITPSYNQGRFIGDNLSSVKNQDYPNIEHIVVDGGSSDNSVAVLRQHDTQYDLTWISEPDRGVGDALNKGFRMSKGEIIGWLNSDDAYFDKRVISYVVERFRACRDVDVMHGDNVLIGEDNLISRVNHSVPWFSYKQLLRSNIIIQSASFYRRSLVQRNPFDVDLGFRVDYEHWLRLANTGFRFRRVGRVLAAKRIHNANVCQVRPDEAKAETRKVKERYGQKFDVKYHVLRCCDWLILALVRRVAGLSIIVWLYTDCKQEDLAFPVKFDSCPKMMLRQLFPFV